MKQENHVAQLAAAQGLQLIVILLALWDSSYTDHGYPLGLYLLADLFLGLSLLPVIAAIRRAPPTAKAWSLILCLLPAYYIYCSVREKGTISVHEWFNS